MCVCVCHGAAAAVEVELERMATTVAPGASGDSTDTPPGKTARRRCPLCRRSTAVNFIHSANTVGSATPRRPPDACRR